MPPDAVGRAAAEVDRLFVYGSLLAGQSARRIVDEFVRGSQPARCRGTLVAFASGYPGVVLDGETAVIGELLVLEDLGKALPLLDAYEGEDFTRILCDVEGGSGIERAWIYVLADPAQVATGTVVADGDWAGYLAAQPPK